MNDRPNDDLEQKLRDGLRRGALPPAPDALRRRLAQLPGEPGRGRFSGLLTGLRLAALATAAAMALAFVLVARSLPAPAVGPGGSIATPSSPPAAVTPSSPPSANPPTPGPTIGPSPVTGFTCGSATVLPATTNAVVQVTEVRVGTHPGYDRIVFEFAGAGRPQLTIAPATPPFFKDPSGLPVEIGGSTFLTLKLYDASGYPVYQGSSAFAPQYPALIALVNDGDFEGYVSWIAGLSTTGCYRVSTLTGPTRIVVDFQAP